MSDLPLSHQQSAYDAAYGNADKVPFPDHKIEGFEPARGKTIVSIGGGTGADIAHLAKENRVYVVDYSAAAAGAARAFGLHPITADLNAPSTVLPFPDGAVDVVVLKDVLEHLLDPETMLARAAALLKPDGYLVLSLPNHLTLWGRLRLLFGGNLVWRGILHDHRTEYDEWNYMHIRFFTWGGVKRLLAKHRLEVTRTFFDFGSFGHYFSIPMYAEHLALKEKTGTLTPKGKLFLKVAHPIYRVLSVLFPERARNLVCRAAPSLFTSCFYVHVRKVRP
jgi:SAM-dependent methyltransferase